MNTSLLATVVGTLLLTNTLSSAQSPRKTISADQGSVVRWAGNCKRCSLEKHAWAAVNGTCYFPVDMDKDPGTYTISRRTTAGKLESAKLTVVAKPCVQEDIKNFTKLEYINISPANMARATRENGQVQKLLRYKSDERPAVFDLPIGKPAAALPKGVGNFGTCRTFNGLARDRHTGQDYPVSGGAPVLSVGNGRVLLVADHFFGGNSVFIDHGNGLVSEYFHLKDATVKTNETVTKGQKVGIVGETGRTTGPHLHLGVRWHGSRINPGFLLVDPTTLPTVQ